MSINISFNIISEELSVSNFDKKIDFEKLIFNRLEIVSGQ